MIGREKVAGHQLERASTLRLNKRYCGQLHAFHVSASVELQIGNELDTGPDALGESLRRFVSILRWPSRSNRSARTLLAPLASQASVRAAFPIGSCDDPKVC